MSFIRKPAKVLFLFLILLLAVQVTFAQSSPIPEEEYAVQYFTHLNKTQKRLDLMNRSGYLSKLGSEEIEGLISGTLSYRTSIKGLSGIVTLTYDNYSDESGWIFNGQIIVTSNLKGNGTFDGTITVTGISPATVYYDKAIMKSGAAGGGTYGFALPGKNRAEVDYTWFFKAE